MIIRRQLRELSRPAGRDKRHRLLVPAVLACVLLAGCGSSAGLTSSTNVAKTSSGMSSMQMGSGSSSKVAAMPGEVGKPVPIQTLGTATWQGMEIAARAMTPVKFVTFDGTTETVVNPPKDASFHLMVMLTTAHTGFAIPYAGVWATIRKDGKIVYDKVQWPMISEYMGPHYGNNVALPGAGTYRLTLTISPPVSARHIEYENVWLKPHSVTMTFKWTPPS